MAEDMDPEKYLVGRDLAGSDLQGADLKGARLMRASLVSADLRGANLKGADLSGANLKGADLTNANLVGADLTNADLQNARLRGGKLDRVKVVGANLHRAAIDVMFASVLEGHEGTPDWDGGPPPNATPLRYAASNGTAIRCSQCAGERFSGRSALLNTRGLTFLDLDWINATATVLVCESCSHLEWFLKPPTVRGG